MKYKFREAILDWPIDKIAKTFQQAGFQAPNKPDPENTRSLIDVYYSTLEFSNDDDVGKLKRFYELILYEIYIPDHDLIERLDEAGYHWDNNFYEIHPQIQPMFEEPDLKHENNDACAYIGAWYTVEKELLPRQYKQSADMLLQQAMKNDNVYDFIYPICFLYRHSIELFLKRLIPPNKGHSLKQLLKKWRHEFRQRYGKEPADYIIDFIEEFETIDNDLPPKEWTPDSWES